jgi:hypothetical protein
LQEKLGIHHNLNQNEGMDGDADRQSLLPRSD